MLRFSFGSVSVICALACVACGGDDDPPSGAGGTAGSAGMGGVGGAGAAGGAGGSSGSGGTSGAAGAAGLPTELPWELTRAAAGTPPTQAEIDAFTDTIVGFWKDTAYFRWQTWIAHGLHASHDPSMPDYGMWWQDTRPIKAGDTITFQHYGGADNIMIRTPKALNQAIAGYLASGDPVMKELVLTYSKGIVALFKGMHWGNEEPGEYITARAIFTHNHSYTTTDGRKVAVDYDLLKGAACTSDAECPGVHDQCPVNPQADVAPGEPGQTCCMYGACSVFNWNAHTVPNRTNPHFGEIWVRNMRSQDDVPHLYRVVPILMRAAQDAPDADVREATAEAVEYLRGFASDVLDNGYQIRTKEDGVAFVPLEPNGRQAKDLASFVRFEALAPNGQCDPILTTDLLATGAPADGRDCGNGVSETYEAFATATNFYNYAIVRFFHIAAAHAALVFRQDDVARRLVEGLGARSDDAIADATQRGQHPEWDAELAPYFLAAATAGMPLTADEAKLVQTQYSAAVQHYATWPQWDPWASSVPDGTLEYEPSAGTASGRVVEVSEMGFLLEYCFSPFKNPAGVELVNCERVLDPSSW